MVRTCGALENDAFAEDHAGAHGNRGDFHRLLNHS